MPRHECHFCWKVAVEHKYWSGIRYYLCALHFDLWVSDIPMEEWYKYENASVAQLA